MTTKLYTDPTRKQAALEESPRKIWWMTLAKVIAGFIVLYLVLQFSPLLMLPRLGQNVSVMITAAVMLGLAVGFQVLFFRRRPLEALRQLGYGRPGGRAIVVALILSGLMLLFFPALVLVTGTTLRLNDDWLLTLASIILFSGLAEETLFRGYVFGNLRRSSPFLRAGFVSLLLFAAVHLYLFVGNPFMIGLAATLVAVSAAYPLAYLFERGGSTLWAPVIVHSATHIIRLVAIPQEFYMPAMMAWLGMQIFMPLLIFAFHKYLK